MQISFNTFYKIIVLEHYYAKVTYRYKSNNDMLHSYKKHSQQRVASSKALHQDLYKTNCLN